MSGDLRSNSNKRICRFSHIIMSTVIYYLAIIMLLNLIVGRCNKMRIKVGTTNSWAVEDYNVQ